MRRMRCMCFYFFQIFPGMMHILLYGISSVPLLSDASFVIRESCSHSFHSSVFHCYPFSDKICKFFADSCCRFKQISFNGSSVHAVIMSNFLHFVSS